MKNTLKMSQFQGDFFPNPETGKWTLKTSLLPCSCIKCREDTGDYTDCYYKDVRGILKQDIQIVNDTATTSVQEDEHGLNALTVKDLRSELNERGIHNPRTLKKVQLKALLIESINEQILFGDNDYDDNELNGVNEVEDYEDENIIIDNPSESDSDSYCDF